MSGFAEDDTDDASVLSDDSLRFLPAQVGDTEELELYQTGGFHPVHLGDLYDEGRYRIVHKLGAGGFSTVWLAYDSLLSCWVALKIVVADKSIVVEAKAVLCHSITSQWSDDRFITYTRYFHIEGPNGRFTPGWHVVSPSKLQKPPQICILMASAMEMLLSATSFFESAILTILTTKASTASLASRELVNWKLIPVIFQARRLRATSLVTLTSCHLKKTFYLTISA
ncbi:hypothetical protein N0V84_009253 [Fusarium piperis]|uniref:non-specific serine/threonine protein kinase n=1 Tax=Fusarium piperis TaxID=1435070 RepID=A0A9W8W6Q2_9HYPO|nr:hypothetical protein N0V84_009253 [Fusarium piperis]